MLHRFSLIERMLLATDVIPHPFTDAAASVGMGFALGSSIKLGIADALSTELQATDAIAAKAKVSHTGCELVLDCLEALGYVHKEGDRYAFTKRGFKSLSPQTPQNFRHFILFCDYLYKGYLNLDETIRQGKRPQSSMLEEMSEYEWELFSRAMIDISQTNVKEVVARFPFHNQHDGCSISEGRTDSTASGYVRSILI